MGAIRQAYQSSDHLLAQAPDFVRSGVASVLAPLLTRSSCPRVLMVEPTNACNGECPLCPVGTRSLTRRSGMLDPELFAGVIDEVGARVQLVIMNFAGEPFLHPQLPDLIRAARSYGARVLVGTNGTRDRAEEIIDSAPTEILFSLDGMTESVYGQYRSYRDGTTIEDVKAHLENLVRAKRRSRSKTRVILQFVVFRHNEHEIDEVLRYAKRIGVDAVDLKPACVNDYFEEDLDALMDRFLPRRSDVTQYRRIGARRQAIRPSLCTFAFHEATLAWNGDVISCCYDADGSQVLGNIGREGSFLRVWNSAAGRRMRSEILRQQLDLCARCGVTSARSRRIDVSSTTAVLGESELAAVS